MWALFLICTWDYIQTSQAAIQLTLQLHYTY